MSDSTVTPLASMLAVLERGEVKGACDCSECAQAAIDAIPDGWVKAKGRWWLLDCVSVMAGEYILVDPDEQEQ